MTATQTERTIEAEQRRLLRALVADGLREPLDTVVGTLQRLMLARAAGSRELPGQALDAQLLSRASTLADDLRQTVDDLIADGTGAGLFDGREPQEAVVVGDLLDAAAASAAHALCDRNLVFCGSARQRITTNPQRFHELLTSLLEAAALDVAQRDLRVRSRRARHELLVELEAVVISGEALDRLRSLARTLGGTVERGDEGVGVVLWLPQQRASDSEV